MGAKSPVQPLSLTYLRVDIVSEPVVIGSLRYWDPDLLERNIVRRYEVYGKLMLPEPEEGTFLVHVIEHCAGCGRAYEKLYRCGDDPVSEATEHVLLTRVAEDLVLGDKALRKLFLEQEPPFYFRGLLPAIALRLARATVRGRLRLVTLTLSGNEAWHFTVMPGICEREPVNVALMPL